MLIAKNKVLLHFDPLILMVIGLVAHGHFLFLNPPPQLTVRDGDPSGGSHWRLLLEYPAHVMQESSGAVQNGEA